MSKVVAMLAALALFCAVPAMAFAQGDTISSGNTQDADVEQEASAGSGGNAGNQAAVVQQNAGDDAIAEVNQSQNFRTGGVVTHGRVHGHGHGHGGRVHGVGGRVHGVGGVGGGVGGVGLAVTGFDAWIVALVGGGLLAGGLGLLATQRRGRLSA